MKMDKQFRELISEELLIEPSEVTKELKLDSGENWDSLAVVAVIAAIDETYNIQVDDEKLLACKTVGEVYELVEKRLS